MVTLFTHTVFHRVVNPCLLLRDSLRDFLLSCYWPVANSLKMFHLFFFLHYTTFSVFATVPNFLKCIIAGIKFKMSTYMLHVDCNYFLIECVYIICKLLHSGFTYIIHRIPTFWGNCWVWNCTFKRWTNMGCVKNREGNLVLDCTLDKHTLTCPYQLTVTAVLKTVQHPNNTCLLVAQGKTNELVEWRVHNRRPTDSRPKYTYKCTYKNDQCV